MQLTATDKTILTIAQVTEQGADLAAKAFWKTLNITLDISIEVFADLSQAAYESGQIVRAWYDAHDGNTKVIAALRSAFWFAVWLLMWSAIALHKAAYWVAFGCIWCAIVLWQNRREVLTGAIQGLDALCCFLLCYEEPVTVRVSDGVEPLDLSRGDELINWAKSLQMEAI